MICIANDTAVFTASSADAESFNVTVYLAEPNSSLAIALSEIVTPKIFTGVMLSLEVALSDNLIVLNSTSESDTSLVSDKSMTTILLVEILSPTTAESDTVTPNVFSVEMLSDAIAVSSIVSVLAIPIESLAAIVS